jgi:hypothetical protein
MTGFTCDLLPNPLPAIVIELPLTTFPLMLVMD